MAEYTSNFFARGGLFAGGNFPKGDLFEILPDQVQFLSQMEKVLSDRPHVGTLIPSPQIPHSRIAIMEPRLSGGSVCLQVTAVWDDMCHRAHMLHSLG